MEQLTKKQLAYEALLSRLQGIDALSNEEISKLSWDVASTKGICSEGGKFYKAFFSSTEFKEKIIEFSEKYCINDYVLRNLIIVMGMSAMRLDEFDDGYYQFILDNINNTDKKVKMQIRRFIWLFPQFLKYENNWDYIISIPKIPPKNESMQILQHIIIWNRGNIVKFIPPKYANIIVGIFEAHIEKYKLHGSAGEYYRKAINTLKKK